MDKFNQLLEILDKDLGVEVVWLYGSRADGTAKPASDYDLAVAFKDVSERNLEGRLRPETLALDWAAKLGLPEGKISIVDINFAPLPLAMNIISNGRVFFSRSGLREAREENRISSMWELDHEYHRREFG